MNNSVKKCFIYTTISAINWIDCVQITSKNRNQGNKFVWNSSCQFWARLITSKMRRVKQMVGVMILMTVSCLTALSNPTDSIGTKVKNGKIFILHKVEKAQGLFSISRRYNVTLDDIIKANPGSDEALVVDQILMIPTGKDAAMEEKAVKDYFSEDKAEASKKGGKASSKKTTFAKYHIVKSGETLYSISVLYNTKVSVLKNLNGLTTDELSLDQKIMVPATKEDKKAQDEKMTEAKQKLNDAEAKLIKLKTVNGASPNEQPVGEVETVKKDKYEVSVETLPNADKQKVSEKGYVEVMAENSETTDKRVCSHHSASVGSIVMITNPENGKAVFVTVVDNHTIDESKGNIIQLSQSALNALSMKSNAAVMVSFAR